MRSTSGIGTDSELPYRYYEVAKRGLVSCEPALMQLRVPMARRKPARSISAPWLWTIGLPK